MALSFIQKAAVIQGGVSSLTVTMGAPLTQGNLVVGTMFTNGSTATNPSGYATDVEIVNVTEDDRLRIVSKIAGASEPDPQWSGLDTGGTTMAGILEFSGNATSTPLDKTSSTGRTDTVTTIQTGSTGTLVQAEEVAVGAVGLRAEVSAPSWDSGLTVGNHTTGGTSVDLFDGYLITAATTALNPTASWTNAATVIAAIATYKAAAGGAAAASIVFDHLFKNMRQGG